MIRTVLILALVAVGGCIPAFPMTAKKSSTEDPNKRIVENWLHRHLNDPSDMEIVEWGKFEQVSIIEGTVDMRDFKGPRFTKVEGGPFGGSTTASREWIDEYERRKEKLPHHPGILGDVAFRARNAMGGRVLSDMAFLIRDGQITAHLMTGETGFVNAEQARNVLRDQANSSLVKTIENPVK
jgi:hypothetical protein